MNRTGLGPEIVTLALVTLGVAAMLNGLSPRGLRILQPTLGRNEMAAHAMDQRTVGTAQQLAIPTVTFTELQTAFRDRERDKDVVLVDARSDIAFRNGHIPGAVPFDHYRLDDAVERSLPRIAGALRIVVYCNGGECNDSHRVAEDLILLGIAPAAIAIYAGGFQEWQARGMPVATPAARGEPDQP